MIVGFYGYGQAMNLRKIIITLGAAGAAVLASALPASAITGPFTWASVNTASWCPSWHGQNGCNTVQTATGYTSSFDPANVSVSGSTVSLLLNSNETVGAAFNTNNSPSPLESYTFPFTISEQINMPCSGSPAVVDNWPSFWMARTTNTGQLAGSGEIDVMEGAKGHLTWAYHYTDINGLLQAKSVTLTDSSDANFPCGPTHAGGDYRYKVHAHNNTAGQPEIDFIAGGITQGGVAQTCSSPCQSIGVPIDTNPRYIINGYGAGTESGPAAGNVSELFKEFSFSAS